MYIYTYIYMYIYIYICFQGIYVHRSPIFGKHADLELGQQRFY